MKAVKAGWKTTEFWASVAASVGAFAASAAGALPAKYATIITAISAAAYALSRGLAKH